MAGTDGAADGRWSRRTIVGTTVLAAVTLAVVALIATRSGDDAIAVPSPLFGQVEQLRPTELPAGWARCGGGPSDRPEATDRWWAQTFGPVAGGQCTPLITVTQVPAGDAVRKPDNATNGRVGNSAEGPGAINWRDDGEGSRGLYASGSGRTQWLVIEGCCGEAATGAHFDLLAVAARDGTREQEPARCTSPESDLDQESFAGNSGGRQSRAWSADDCPVRSDIVSWRTEPKGHHCWPEVVFLVVGTPVGAPFTDEGARLYVRDPEGELTSGRAPDPGLDLDATLPSTATDTGLHQGDAELWVDAADDQRVYVVTDDHVEAWPASEGAACA